jgi:hypothetical protein
MYKLGELQNLNDANGSRNIRLRLQNSPGLSLNLGNCGENATCSARPQKVDLRQSLLACQQVSYASLRPYGQCSSYTSSSLIGLNSKNHVDNVSTPSDLPSSITCHCDTPLLSAAR